MGGTGCNAFPHIFFLNHFRNLKFAGDFSLTEATPRALYTILSLFLSQNNTIAIFKAFVFVMALCRDSSGRTVGYTGLTYIIEVVKAIGPVMGVKCKW